jgi:hypothetical protein
VAARLRREFNADVEIVGGPYGHFQVLLDGGPVLDAGRLAALGVLPSSQRVVDVLREKLASDV